MRIPPAVRFYVSLGRAMVSDFHSRWGELGFWTGLFLGLLAAFYPSLARRLSLTGGSLSPWWGVAVMVAVLGYSYLRLNFGRFTLLEHRLVDAERRESAGARRLGNEVLAIEQVAIPVTDPGSGMYLGRGLALRCTNRSEEAMTVRCRLVEFGRALPNGEFEPEDWFHERWLRWVDDTTEERLVPGGHRECMVVRQTYGYATTTGHGAELPHTVLPGRIRATINLEADGFAVRRLVVRLEWRPAEPPYSPGEALVWLGTDSDTGL